MSNTSKTTLITIAQKSQIIESDHNENNYQTKLTNELDNRKEDFDQNVINEIVLWKVNRYAELKFDTLQQLNGLPEKFNKEKVKILLVALLNEKGIRLPMASTILRFKQPHNFQILDKRVYRVLFGKEYKESTVIEKKVELYFNYLEKLKKVVEEIKIPFENSDRILYNFDKRVNNKISIKY